MFNGMARFANFTKLAITNKRLFLRCPLPQAVLLRRACYLDFYDIVPALGFWYATGVTVL